MRFQFCQHLVNVVRCMVYEVPHSVHIDELVPAYLYQQHLLEGVGHVVSDILQREIIVVQIIPYVVIEA